MDTTTNRSPDRFRTKALQPVEECAVPGLRAVFVLVLAVENVVSSYQVEDGPGKVYEMRCPRDKSREGSKSPCRNGLRGGSAVVPSTRCGPSPSLISNSFDKDDPNHTRHMPQPLRPTMPATRSVALDHSRAVAAMLAAAPQAHRHHGDLHTKEGQD
ncbi:uncharacterized protein RCC_03774 [Ramularia collo-cygni]|uniref:Uncharacterized protein n=1 Tax=Ramularia collo-cygni TaxID=112498 RepID=A0A2D3V324_9PEZI|nr:uncharacterized protein RCC_03774 [Ramularia collo-cygni]CZT17936.1 uncharacterized protein RCC_03774 [Ramularia collo-cygni]